MKVVKLIFKIIGKILRLPVIPLLGVLWVLGFLFSHAYGILYGLFIVIISLALIITFFRNDWRMFWGFAIMGSCGIVLTMAGTAIIMFVENMLGRCVGLLAA